MFKFLRRILYIYIIIDIIIISIAYCISYLLKYNKIYNIFNNIYLPEWGAYLFILLLWIIFTIVLFCIRSLYVTDREVTIPREAFNVLSSLLCVALIIAAVIFFGKFKFYSRDVFLNSFILFLVFLSGWRMIKRLVVRKLISEGFHNINVLIVGAGVTGKMILNDIKNHPYWGLNVVGFLDDKKNSFIEGMPVLGKLSNFAEVAKRHFIDEAIIAVSPSDMLISGLMKEAKKLNLSFRVVADSFEDTLPPASDVTYLGITPLFTYKVKKRHPAEFAFKRIFDILASVIALIILFPCLIVISIFVKISSPGPVFYIQKRSGFKGREFYFYKFRTMVKDADTLKSKLMDKNESAGNIIFKIRNDPRVTRIGSFLRKHSLDEFTQLFNVLKGDMSLVGPRPFPTDESKKIDYNYLKRLTIRPGITGLAQIRGRSDLSFYKWVKWDLWYIDNWSFWLDLVILWKTLPVIFKGKGAY